MTTVKLICVRRSEVGSRIGHLMHAAGRRAIGVVAPVRRDDAPTVPRPAVSCVVLPASDVRTRLGELESTTSVDRPDLEELRYQWRCEYLGYDPDKPDRDPRHRVTYFEPPGGREVAFISFGLFSKLHDGATVEVVMANLADLT